MDKLRDSERMSHVSDHENYSEPRQVEGEISFVPDSRGIISEGGSMNLTTESQRNFMGGFGKLKYTNKKNKKRTIRKKRRTTRRKRRTIRKKRRTTRKKRRTTRRKRKNRTKRRNSIKKIKRKKYNIIYNNGN